MATEKQVRFLGKLVAERDLEMTVTDFTVLTTSDASRLIDRLLRAPRKTVATVQPQATNGTPVTTPGVFETDEGIFVVKPNREKTRLYAKRLVETRSDRLNENEEHVQVDFEYAPGAIFRIREENRMDVERAKALTIRYGRCICCGRHLKVAQSVERGIGPVCITYFAA